MLERTLAERTKSAAELSRRKQDEDLTAGGAARMKLMGIVIATGELGLFVSAWPSAKISNTRSDAR